jgi:hypothetical protein
MARSFSTAVESMVVGMLAAAASLCALQASGAETHSVVAQSTPATAGTGRRPISSRIVAGSLPLRLAPRTATQPPKTETTPPDTAAAVGRAATLDRVRQVLARRPDVGAPLQPALETVPSPAMEVADEATVESPEPLAQVAARTRLEFDIRESRLFLAEGERVVLNISVRNVGSTPVRRVEAALYFADGVEPVEATGHAAAIAVGGVRLEPIAALDPGDFVEVDVTAVGIRPGSVVYRSELACEELPGVLAREGALRVEPRITTASP